MRPPRNARRLAALWLLAAVSAFAQAPTTQPPASLLTPITLDEPRAFPPAGDYRSIVPAYPQQQVTQPPATRHAPAADVRLIAAEQPVPSAPPTAPRRLAPRSDAPQKSLARPTAVSPGKTLGTVGGSLAIVLGLFAVIVWCAKKASPQAAAMLPKEAVEVLGRAVLASRQQVQLVRVGSKLLLVALAPNEAQTLTEITAPAEVEHLLGLCRRGQATSASAAFVQTLNQLAQEPAEPGFFGSQRSKQRGAS